MTPHFDQARALIRQFKGDAYLNGFGVLAEAGRMAAGLGATAVLVHDDFPGAGDYVKTISDSLRSAGIEILESVPGARPNAPREDVARITARVSALKPALLVSFGGGSTIDAAKAAERPPHPRRRASTTTSASGMVTQALAATGKTAHAASRHPDRLQLGAHLTKYSNITDLSTGQKKLIVDDGHRPRARRVRLRRDASAPRRPHCRRRAGRHLPLASKCSTVAVGKPAYAPMEEIAAEGHRPRADATCRASSRDPRDREAREALGLATDLGGYAIMIGGTNGAASHQLLPDRHPQPRPRLRACSTPTTRSSSPPPSSSRSKLVARDLPDAGYAGAAESPPRGPRTRPWPWPKR